jgi:hypothetical protein
MKELSLYKMLNMFFAYNEKTNNYYLVRHYSYGSGYLIKYYEIYSEYKELSHLINDFNKYMRLEFLEKADYVENNLLYSKKIESSPLKEYNELDILKANFEVLKEIGLNYIIINLELVETSVISLKLKELSNLYLVNTKEDINEVLNFKFNIWHKESLEKLSLILKEDINNLQNLKNNYNLNFS